MAHAKLFWTGRSQAVRLPKAYRFEGEEVRIRRVGAAVILEPVASDWAWLDAVTGPVDADFAEAAREAAGRAGAAGARRLRVRWLLDTNAVIEVLRGNVALLGRLRQWAPEEVGVSAIVMHELFYGAFRSARVEANVARVDGLRFAVAAFSARTRGRPGRCGRRSRRRGRGSGLMTC